MAANLADDIFKCIFLNEYNRIQIQISLNLVPGSPIDNKQALVQVMAWCWTGDKPLSKPMLTQFTDVFMRHYSVGGGVKEENFKELHYLNIKKLWKLIHIPVFPRINSLNH